MSKEVFLEQLSAKLNVLPVDERQDALSYYDGYISDSGDEAAAIAQLGSPGEVAANILANYVSNSSSSSYYGGASKRGLSGAKVALIIFLGLFALPIGLPLIIVLAVIPFTLIITLFAVVFSFAISGFAMIVVGIIAVVGFPVILVQDFWFAVMTAGAGLTLIGVGILMLSLTRLLQKGFRIIAKIVADIILYFRKRKNVKGDFDYGRQ